MDMKIVKNFSVLIFVLALLSASVFSVRADSSVSFEVESADAKPGRLLTVAVTADCDKKLCAATFEFTFDEDFLAFRKAQKSDSGSKIEYNQTNNKVKLVFLNSEGKNVAGGKEIFTLTFKALKQGTTHVNFSVEQCVDSNVDFIDAGTCTASVITIEKNAADTADTSSDSSDKTNGKSGGSSGKSGKSSNAAAEAETTDAAATYDNLGSLNPIDDNSLDYFLAGAGLAVGSAIIFGIIFIIIRKAAAVKTEKNKNINDKSIKPNDEE